MMDCYYEEESYALRLELCLSPRPISVNHNSHYHNTDLILTFFSLGNKDLTIKNPLAL